VYAIYNGYPRHWIPGGALGTVFESTDGGPARARRRLSRASPLRTIAA
jgi:hypothetical protein